MSASLSSIQSVALRFFSFYAFSPIIAYYPWTTFRVFPELVVSVQFSSVSFINYHATQREILVRKFMCARDLNSSRAPGKTRNSICGTGGSVTLECSCFDHLRELWRRDWAPSGRLSCQCISVAVFVSTWPSFSMFTEKLVWNQTTPSLLPTCFQYIPLWFLSSFLTIRHKYSCSGFRFLRPIRWTRTQESPISLCWLFANYIIGNFAGFRTTFIMLKMRPGICSRSAMYRYLTTSRKHMSTLDAGFKDLASVSSQTRLLPRRGDKSTHCSIIFYSSG